ncbi:MAG: hypothetical protein ACTSXL_05385 [Alphaproteobacteria bacterium]
MKKKHIILFVLLISTIGVSVYFFPNKEKNNCSHLSAYLLKKYNYFLIDKIVQKEIAEKTINCYTGNIVKKNIYG